MKRFLNITQQRKLTDDTLDLLKRGPTLAKEVNSFLVSAHPLLRQNVSVTRQVF